MVAFHRLLSAGRPAAEALAEAQRRVAGGAGEEDAAATVAAAGFVCLGADPA